MPIFHAADGAALSFTDDGPRGAIPLLFLHGWHATGAVWQPVIERLAPRHRTIAIDLRGFGGSSGAPGPYRVETFSDDLSALVAALDLDPTVAVGHSMGAAVGQRFAIDRPDAVEGLVLVSPVPAGGMRLSPKTEAAFRATAGDAVKTNAWLAQLTYVEPAPAVRQILRAAAASVPARVTLESLASWAHLDFADEAATIGTPTLVLAGSGDRPEFARERVADLIAGSRMKVVPESGHYLPLEKPALVAESIERFIQEL